MEKKWTPQQEQAISLHGRNLLVSAAAGSGKTAVLVERIIQMITQDTGVDLDQLLILTFTRAAAMEMKERIAAMLNRLLMEKPEDERIQRQIALLGHANITTIDSFCLRIVRDYFSELDLDPDFRIGEEGELTLLQADCMAGMLESCYEAAEPEFLEFAEAYGGGKGDERLEGYITNVYRFAQSCPYPEDWIEDAAAAFQISVPEELESLPIILFLKEFYHTLFQELEMEAKNLLAICQEADGPYAYEDMMQSDLRQIQDFLSAQTLDELCQCAASVQFVRKTTKKQKEADEKKKAYVSMRRDVLKEQVKKAAGELSKFEADTIFQQMQAVRQPMEVLLKLAADYGRCYREAKAEKNLVDFNDLEHLALSILVKKGEGRTAAARELQQQFTEILIDEYQDSNYLQDMILESISGKEDGHPNMFMVGDVKQSIYRFRMARPEIFMEKYASYSKTDSLYQKIDLQKNFRSRSEVLLGINRIFERIMTKALGNVEYDEAAALYPGAAYPPISDPARTEKDPEEAKALKLILVDVSRQETHAYIEENQLNGNFDSTAMEAHAAAAQIRQILDPANGQMVLDKETGTYRQASYRDIVILLRSLAGKAETYLDVLTAEGIPACAPASGYFDALEVRMILSLLQIIDNPLQDIPLAAVLKSPLGNFTSQDLAEIAVFYKNVVKTAESGLYPAIQYYIQQKPEDVLSDKLRQFLEKLQEYQERAAYLPVYELLQFLYKDTGYYDYVSAMPAGIVRKMNLDMLIEKAISYEKTSYHGLFHFVRYMEHLKKYEVDFEQGQAFGEQDDIVRIYSIHKSKGLEYPIVILGGLTKAFNQLDSRSPILLHPELGIAADYIDTEKRCRIPSIAATAIKQRLKVDTLGEELRILYVAMTRAREKLIMIAADPWLEKHLEQYEMEDRQSRTLPFYRLLSANSYMDWIGFAAGNRLEQWMDLEVYSVHEILQNPVVKQAENISRIQELYQIGEDAGTNEKVYEDETRKKLEQIRTQCYPYEDAVKIQSKFSVSELKKNSWLTKAEEEESEAMLLPELHSVPAFMKEGGEEKAGVWIGTAYHRALELLSPDRTWHTEVIQKELDSWVAAGRLQPEAAKQISCWKLYQFYQSDLGKRIREADKRKTLHREQQFLLSLPAERVNSEWNSKEPVLIQGVIDAWFEENGNIILVDYKTDRNVTEEELKERYQRQLSFYQQALEQILGEKVAEVYLWSFSLAKAIKMENENA